MFNVGLIFIRFSDFSFSFICIPKFIRMLWWRYESCWGPLSWTLDDILIMRSIPFDILNPPTRMVYWNIAYYHLNCGVIQGFPALRKAVTSLSVRLINELQSLHYFQYKVVFRNFLELCRLKHQKIRIAGRQSGSNFPRRGGKPTH